MDEQVDKPVRDHDQRGADRSRAPFRGEPDQRAEHCTPKQRAEQAVGVGHMIEVHRVHRRDTRHDPHLFDPGHEQRGKADVDELRGDEQRSESRRLRASRGDERRGKMADEHARDAIVAGRRVKLDRT